jgi:CRISPR-associated protein Cmr6
MSQLVLPNSTVTLINGAADNHRHPGLQLDKFSIPGNQQAQKAALDQVSAIPGDPDLLCALIQRRKRFLESLPGTSSFSCKTTGPLTLHLSRASALENAGICLHPLYGFACLPGSGLKGMARAFAETLWLPVQSDQNQAWRQIEDVFGWAPNPDRKQQIKDPNHPAQVRRENDAHPDWPEVKASSGSIVFHDAWPTNWPQLFVDIVNNHHPDYYQRDDNDHPPGDWESPEPVYFLAVKPGTTFTFALSKRRAEVPDELLSVARQWLLGALCHLGAGAKTNAGYGAFKPAEDVEKPLQDAVAQTWQAAAAGTSPRRAVFETTLKLVTPAFLAGAEQYGNNAKEGCDLRPATLRGQLRWWWRTLHAGFLDVKTLRALEAAIWGDTRAGGAVRIALTPRHGGTVCLYSHPRDRQSGTRYLAYGMDETSREQKRQRFSLNPNPPASWNLRLIARPGRYAMDRHDAANPRQQLLTAATILDQAKAALWLLCTYGGVGSKCRKGFGSLAASGLDDFNLDRCRSIGCQVREQHSVNTRFSPDRAESPGISDPDLRQCDITVHTDSSEDVIDRIGRAYSAVAARFKHNTDQNNDVQSPNKGAWGLPRKIHGPREDGPIRRRDGTPVQNPDTWKPPEWLDFPKRQENIKPQNARHASPIHIHIDENPSGEFVVRVLAMPAKYLPNRNESVRMLRVFVDAFSTAFDATPAHSATSRSRGRTLPAPRPAASGPAKRRSGTPAHVTILALRPKGGYDVQEEGRPQGTLTVGTPPDPAPSVGDVVDVEVHDDAPGRPQYRWPRPKDGAKAKFKPKDGSGSSGGPHRGWR